MESTKCDWYLAEQEWETSSALRRVRSVRGKAVSSTRAALANPRSVGLQAHASSSAFSSNLKDTHRPETSQFSRSPTSGISKASRDTATDLDDIAEYPGGRGCLITGDPTAQNLMRSLSSRQGIRPNTKASLERTRKT